MTRRLLLLLLLLVLGGCVTSGPRPRRPVRLSPAERVQEVLPLVREAARKHNVSQSLILAVIQIESGFRPTARSHVGARGLMQLMPRTAASLARRLGLKDYDIDDPRFNIDAGTAYLAYLLRLFDGDLRLALAGYNTGPMRVRRWVRQGRAIRGGVGRYVEKVLAVRDRFEAQGAQPRALPEPELDRDGLRALVRSKQAQYGERPDEPLPEG